MSLNDALATSDTYLLFAMIGGALVFVGLLSLLAMIGAGVSATAARTLGTLAVAAMLTGGVLGGISLHSKITHIQDLTRGVVTYVHDHNQLTAMDPVTLDSNGHGATFDATRADGSTVHVHITWNTSQTADGSPAPAGHSPIVVDVTP